MAILKEWTGEGVMQHEDLREKEQFLSFMLAGNLFAFDVLRTREVLSLPDITPIPCAPPYVAGVLNLRGSVVSVIDLRRKFGLKEGGLTADTAVIIVEAVSDGENLVLGALVDAVRGVISFENGVEPPPKIGTRVNIELLNGIGKHNGAFIMVLNIDRVISEEEIELLKETVKEAEDEGSLEK